MTRSNGMRESSRVVALALYLFIVLGCADSIAPMTVLDGSVEVRTPDRGMPVDAAQGTSDAGNAEAAESCPNSMTFDATGIRLVCGENAIRFAAEVRVNDRWLAPNVCESISTNNVTCPIGDVGILSMSVQNNVWQPSFRATSALTFDGFRLRGVGRVQDVESWLSNGFQSWSQSGLIAIGPRFSEVTTNTALRAQGDLEVVRGGTELSWWLSYAVAPTNFIVGATTARNFKTWIQLNEEEDAFYCTVTSGQTEDNIVMVNDEEIEGEDVWISFTEDLNAGLFDYASALPSRVPQLASAEVGWNSWYELWDDIDESDIMENARLVPDLLDPIVAQRHRPYRIVVDDGWQLGWGEWRANLGFPNGMQATAEALIAENFRPGIWMAPLLVSENSPLVAEHPEWFLPEASFTHLAHGTMKILDVTHPEAAEKLRSDVRHLVNAGFSLLKIDFLFAGTYTSARHEPMPAMRAYELALSLIREAAGPETVLLAVGSPPIAGFSAVDAWRLGPDIAVQLFDASWYFVQGTARSTAARWPFCVHTLCDGDPALLRVLPRSEVEAGAWIASLAGGAFFLSDDLRQLEPMRRTWLISDAINQGVSGKPAVPVSSQLNFVPRQLNSQLLEQSRQQATHQLPTIWSLHDGRELRLNVTDEAAPYEENTLPPRSAEVGPQ